MNITLKVIRSIWLLLNLLAMFGFALPVHAASQSLHVIDYDGQTQPSIGYDERSPSVFDYDSASEPLANENENRSAGTSGVFAKLAELLAAEGGAARLGSLTPAQARQIQAFSDKFGAEVNVVGSRAAGTAGPFSDFDYVIGGNSSLRHSAERFLPKNPQSVMGNEAGNLPFRGIDIFNANKTPLDPTRPFIQFTPGQPPVVGPR